jgi:hypothetical protein
MIFDRKGARRGAQALKVSQKQNEEVTYFFQCVSRGGYQAKKLSPSELFPPSNKASSDELNAGAINFDIYESIHVVRSGPQSADYPAIESFEELAKTLPGFLVANIERMKYKKPTPIQKHAIPLSLGGQYMH